MVSKEKIIRNIGQQYIIVKLINIRLSWYGHISRMSEYGIPKQVMPNGQMKKGQTEGKAAANNSPRLDVEEPEPSEGEGSTRDRGAWSKFLGDLRTT